MINDEVKQFKLSSGEEIIAKVISWPDEEDENQIVICQPMKMVSYEQTPVGPRLYIMRPWMVLQDSPNQHQVLYYDQIIGLAQPSIRMINQYNTVLETFNLGDSDEDVDSPELTELMSFDSDAGKIITFPGGRTIH